MTTSYPIFAPDPRLSKLKRTYPTAYLRGLPPDPRRKSPNLMIISQVGPHGPLKVVCCNGCGEKGKAQLDGSCRHTDTVMADLKPWWRSRARPVQAGQDAAEPPRAIGRARGAGR